MSDHADPAEEWHLTPVRFGPGITVHWYPPPSPAERAAAEEWLLHHDISRLSVIAISPSIVMMEREGDGASTSERRDRHDTLSDAPVRYWVVPETRTRRLAFGALTLTITETEGTGGFVAVRPAVTDYHNTSSINWFGPGQSLANTVTSGVDANRQITLRAGANSTHVIVDITGYYR